MSEAISIVAMAGVLLAGVAGLLLFGRARMLPAVQGTPPSCRISVIVPARNEEGNLSVLLGSLANQDFPAHEVLVVDDQSSDGTARVAGELGARVIAGSALPEGWFGKPWACQQGADEATGDWLLFLDADLELEAGALARMAGLTREKGAVFSVCPYHRVRKPYEQLSVFFNLLMMAGINAFSWRGDRAEGIGLFGQSMLVSKEDYLRVGGHGAVRRTVLENLHLAGEFERLGVARRCYAGRGSVGMRMFPGGFADLRDGWVKGFASGAGLTPRGALVLSALWLTGLMVLIVCLLLLPLGDAETLRWVGLAYGLAGLSLWRWFRLAGSFSLGSVLLFPLCLLFYQWLFARAVARSRAGGTTVWKGRDVA